MDVVGRVLCEHEIEERSGGPGASVFEIAAREKFSSTDSLEWVHVVFCGKCLRGTKSFIFGPEDGGCTDVRKDKAREEAWESFLKNISWDCGEAVVDGVMSD